MGALKSSKLSHLTWSKRRFDPSSKADLQEYKYFMDNKRWTENCPFHLEWPYLTITDMIKSKLIDLYIDTIIKNAK